MTDKTGNRAEGAAKQESVSENASDMEAICPIRQIAWRRLLANGELVEVTGPAGRAGQSLPTAITQAVWDRYVAAPVAGCCCAGENERLWHIVWGLRLTVTNTRPTEPEIVYEAEFCRSGRVTFKAAERIGDDGQSVVVISLPDENFGRH